MLHLLWLINCMYLKMWTQSYRDTFTLLVILCVYIVCNLRFATHNVSSFLRNTFAPRELESGSRSKRTERNFDHNMKKYAQIYVLVVHLRSILYFHNSIWCNTHFLTNKFSFTASLNETVSCVTFKRIALWYQWLRGYQWLRT